MGAQKIKVVKKSPEKVVEAPSLSQRFKDWTESHSREIAALGVVVLLLLAALWGFNAYRQSRDRAARADYAQVLAKWPDEGAAESQAWEALIPELEKHIREHEGTASALNAQLDLARVYTHLKRYDEALAVGRQALDAAPSGHTLRPLIEYQLALTYEAMGKDSEAEAQWTALRAEAPPELKREVDWHLARIFAQRQDYSKAVEHYEQALKASGAYPNAILLQEELAAVRRRAGSSS